MARTSRSAGTAALVALALGWGLASADPSPAPPNARPASPAAVPVESPADCPPVAIVTTSGRSGQSELHFVSSSRRTRPPLATLDHLPEGNVRAEVIAGSQQVLVNAPLTPGRDVSFNGGLFLMQPGSSARLLATGLVHASRPLVTTRGRVFVTRGTAGPYPSDPGRYRVDRLTVDEIELPTGQVRTIHTHDGYAVHLAGWYPPELILYRVGPDGADIAAVNADSAAVRVLLAELPPFGRDFSVDRQRGVLVYRGRHESDSRRWVVDELDLRTGSVARRLEGAAFASAPHVWPGGAVAVNPSRRGLQLLGSADPVAAPFGPGVDVVRALSNDERFVALLHTVAGRLPLPYVLERHTGHAVPLAVPKGQRAAIAGFLSGKAVLP